MPIPQALSLHKLSSTYLITPTLEKNVYIKKLFVNNGQNKYDNIYLVYKYPDNAQLKSSPYASPTYMHKPKVFRIAEMYLIAAEAAYKKGDQTNAKTYLDRLRTARGIGSVTYTDLGLKSKTNETENSPSKDSV